MSSARGRRPDPARRIPFASLVSDFIRFRCRCGHVLQVPESLAGQEARCPSCHAVETAPGAEAIPELAPMPAKHESAVPEVAPIEDAPETEVEEIPEAEDELPELKPMDDAGGAAKGPEPAE